MFSSLKPLAPYFWKYRRGMVTGGACVLLTNGIWVYFPQVIGHAVDDLKLGVTREKLVTYSLLLVGVAAAKGIFQFLTRWILIGISRDIEFDLRNDLFRHLEGLSHDYYQRTRTGDIMARATNDLNSVRMMLGPAIMYSANTVVFTAGALMFMWGISPRLTLLAFLPLPLVSILVQYFGHRIHQRFERIQSMFSEISARVQENLSGARVVRAYVQEEAEIAQFQTANRDYIARSLKLVQLMSMLWPTLQTLLGFAIVLVLWVGGREVLLGRITVGEFVTFNTYMVQLTFPIIALGWVINIYQRGTASLDRINQILTERPSISDEKAAAELRDADIRLRGEIEFRGLSFAFPNAASTGGNGAGTRGGPVLRNINLRIPAGSTSPRYGEKWGRHWLDLVRYSDTAGFELDSYIHDAWRYRDWVIQAFNDDKPYDRFIQEQIAGDELFPEDPVAHTGTGLYCVGPNRDLFPDQADINREEILTDYVDTTSSVFLGLTAGCARCHDHKFDPISQEDHYRIRAVFAPAVKTKVALNRLTSLGFDVAESVREWKLREIGEQIRAAKARCDSQTRSAKLSMLPADAQQALRLTDTDRTQRQRELATQYQSAARVSDDEVRACMTPDEAAKLHRIEKLLVGMFTEYRSKPFACGIADWWNVAPKTFLPSRGSRPEREVQPGFFTVLGGGEVPPPAEKREATGPIPLMPTTGRRSALAKWITDPANPLTARVMVNRVWQYHFGRGLVATPSDLGTRGGKPTHPELLDWLASEFVAKGWSVKQLHRLIMTSAAYQQQSTPYKDAVERDPANLLLSHFNRRRLNSDEVRDSVLQATGALNLKAGGRPVVPPLTPEEKATLTQRPDDAWVLTADTSEYLRRSLYMIQKRTFRMPIMEVFDAPDSMLTCPRRDSSTTAPQSLSLFNGSLTMERARSLSVRVAAESMSSDESAIRGAWNYVLSRDPSPYELNRAITFLAAQNKNTGGRNEALLELIRALLNTNEFLYVD